MEEIYKLSNYNFSEDLVGISLQLDDNNNCIHSGLIICLENEIYYFHYTGLEVKLENLTNTYNQKNNIVFKKLDIINKGEETTFLGFCEDLLENGVHPIYGFIFNDSYYDPNTGESYLVNSIHDITTCSGFCIKVIRGFIYNHPEYLKLNDWTLESLNLANTNLIEFSMKTIREYAIEKNITSTEELFQTDELKRISPSEILASTFFNELPIRKIQIDQILLEVESTSQSL